MADSPPDARFEQAKAHFFDGLECFRAGRFEEAERHYLQSLQAVPQRASTLINLAATQLQLSRPGDALTTAEAALEIEPHGTEAMLHRATALMQLGRLDEALAEADRLLARDDGLAAAWLRRAQTLERLGRAADALASYQRVLNIEPASAEAWGGRGTLLRELHRLDEAAHAFAEALRLGADPDLYGYYLASVNGQRVPATAPGAYVEGLFDDYADEFDDHLVGKLRYSAHTRLIEGLDALARGPFESALDLGCGTGLCGVVVRPGTRYLTGVDLSARMLDKARERGVYDKLVHADVVEHLQTTDARHDLILSTDVFIYIGDLEPLFAAARQRMERGVFCFSVEVLEEGGEADFSLLPSLRYAHSERYLRRLAAAHGFDWIASSFAQVREDQRDPVPGLFVYLSAAAR